MALYRDSSYLLELFWNI